jgi:uncharacterized membrane protein YhaH (DUF805 family)|tara:strand:- start:778 stop:1104 length:327 start_codon:yes stop_codon:yes gene_type:complete
MNKIKYLFSFSENAGRANFLYILVGSFLLLIIPSLFFENLINNQNFFLLLLLLFLVISFANLARRLNDLNKHPGFVLIYAIPIVNLIFLFYLLSIPGKEYKKNNEKNI